MAISSGAATSDTASEQIVVSELDIANRAKTEKTFGLVTVRGYLRRDGLACPESVDVNFAGHHAHFRGEECFVREGENAWRLMVNLVTHLVPNGPQEITVSVKVEDGEEIVFAPLKLNVNNSTKLADAVRDDLRKYGTDVILPRIIDSSFWPYDTGKARAWFDEIEAEDTPLSFDQAEDLQAAHRHLERWGFCILPERLPEKMISNFKSQLFDAIEKKRLIWEEGSSDRIHQAHTLPAGRQIWLYPPVLEFLESHFRDTPCACQTLTYVNGSEQNAHQDTIHLTPYPAGFMCGVWVALEDVRPDSGELFVYPGSHKVPRLRAGKLGLEKVDEDYSSYHVFDAEVMRLMEEGGFERMEYRPKAGQILVWHENLVHGGSPRRDRSQTRVSIVSHYFAKGSVAYYDSRGEAAALETLPGLE